jgi:hypothetical protein
VSIGTRKLRRRTIATAKTNLTTKPPWGGRSSKRLTKNTLKRRGLIINEATPRVTAIATAVAVTIAKAIAVAAVVAAVIAAKVGRKRVSRVLLMVAA